MDFSAVVKSDGRISMSEELKKLASQLEEIYNA